jgi:hypothetical protein
MITYAPVARAALTVASYLDKNDELTVPPREGVMSCQAKGTRKMLAPSPAKCAYCAVGGETPVPVKDPSVVTLRDNQQAFSGKRSCQTHP